MITSTQIQDTESFALIAVLLFKLLSRKVLLINRKGNGHNLYKSTSISPQEMWSKIFLSNPKSQTTWRNPTGLIESLPILPLTNSQLE